MTGDRELLSTIQKARHTLESTGPPAVRSEGDFERVALPHADGDALRDLLVADHAKTVIEIGLAYGSSALAIAEAVVGVAGRSARHVIVDAYQDQFHRAGWDAIVAVCLDEVCSLVAERSQLALAQLASEGFRADAAFVDGSHVFHNVFVDLFFVSEIVHPGGLVVIDDCEWPSVATAVRYFELNTGWRHEPSTRDTRLRAYRLPACGTEPDFEAFRPFGLAPEA